MLPGALNAPLAHQKAAAVDFQAAVGLVPQENVDDVKISAGINGKGILNVRLALHYIIADGDRAHVGDTVHG